MQICYAVNVINEKSQTIHGFPTQPYIMWGLKTKEKYHQKNVLPLKYLSTYYLPMYWVWKTKQNKRLAEITTMVQDSN